MIVEERSTLFHRMGGSWKYYLWISPFFVIFFVFQLYPILYGVFVSFTAWPGYGKPRFVGLGNYGRAFSDPLFWKSLVNTFLLWLYIVPIRTFLALLLAVLISAPRMRGGRALSFVVLLPNVTAIVVVAIIFRMLLTTNGGFVNALLHATVGIHPIHWLTSTKLSKVSIAIMNLWKVTGYLTIVMLGGLQRIPQNVHEAAEIDGCGATRKFFQITIPLMVPVIFFVFVISTIWIFQNVADSMVLTGGGPRYSSTPLILYVYFNAFDYVKVGYASALTFILFVILAILSSGMVRTYRRRMES